jgi:hypothetical protein
MATTLYARIGEAAPGGITLPAGFLGAWNQSDATHAGVSAKTLDVNAGSLQQSTTKTWTSVNNNSSQSLGHCQFASSPLAAQTISAGNWTVGFAALLSNATGTLINGWFYTPYIALYLVNGATGAIRTTIFALGAPTGAATSLFNTTEFTAYSTTCSGSSATATAGDYLVLELGILAQTVIHGAFTPATNLFADGTTVINTDDAATSDAKSFITAPVNLTFQATIIEDEAGILHTFRRNW